MPLSTQTRKLHRAMEKAHLRSSVNPRIARLERLIVAYERLLAAEPLRGTSAVTERAQEEWRAVIVRAQTELAALREAEKGPEFDEE